MDHPADSNAPIVTTDVAVKDVGSAIDFILQRRGISRINLMGWSWGTVTMGAYTADHNDKVERLVLYAPVWLTASPPSQTARPALGAYVSAPMATARDRLQAGAPDDRKNDLMPVSWFEAWSAAALATDPVGSKQNPPVLRSPAGVFHDIRNYWEAGKPYYDPGRIKVPTLVIAAEWDRVTPSQGRILLRQAARRLGENRHCDGGTCAWLALLLNRQQHFDLYAHSARRAPLRRADGKSSANLTPECMPTTA
jgi:pimeloyl-ACP methyl ester carboxylesterase